MSEGVRVSGCEGARFLCQWLVVDDPKSEPDTESDPPVRVVHSGRSTCHAKSGRGDHGLEEGTCCPLTLLARLRVEFFCQCLGVDGPKSEPDNDSDPPAFTIGVRGFSLKIWLLFMVSCSGVGCVDIGFGLRISGFGFRV